jgi:hypothetical protein
MYSCIPFSPIFEKVLLFERIQSLDRSLFWQQQHVDKDEYGALARENRHVRIKACPSGTVCRKFDMERPGIEPGPSRSEACD